MAKPRHSPSDRDQQARQKLQQKAKIRNRAYIQLGEDTLKTVHKTFQPGVSVILHLLALTDGSLNLKENTTPNPVHDSRRFELFRNDRLFFH